MTIIDKIREEAYNFEYKNLKPSIVLLSEDNYREFQMEMYNIPRSMMDNIFQYDYEYLNVMNNKLEIIKCKGINRIEVYSNGDKIIEGL